MDAFDSIPNDSISDAGLLRFITAGNVDDGKSSLIGRLLYDAKALSGDQLAALEHAAARQGIDTIDLSLVTDGLAAEREQGITIDVAYRYFSTPRRNFIIADTPGHEQYTRNMVTGASTADAAVVLVDVRRGMTTQTHRHLCLAHLLGIRHLVVAVNKMDLVGFAKSEFAKIGEAISQFAAALGASPPKLVPVSAKLGDNIVHKSERTLWYSGDSLLGILEKLPRTDSAAGLPFRMPVQLVQRTAQAGGTTRRYLGRIEAGRIEVGDAVMVLPAKIGSHVRAISTYEGSLAAATAPTSVAIELADDVDVTRGDLLAAAEQPARTGRNFEAMLCWLTDMPYDPTGRYLLKCGTSTTPARLSAVLHRLNVATFAVEEAPAALRHNDIVRVRVTTAAPLTFDAYRHIRQTGSFILIDDANRSAAGGMIEDTSSWHPAIRDLPLAGDY
jgi:sulfate adenylyltransferase subunit 1